MTTGPPSLVLLCVARHLLSHFSRVSTPVKRKNRDLGGERGYGTGQINAYPPPAAGANPAAGAVMMSLAEELLTKKGLSLKDLQVCFEAPVFCKYAAVLELAGLRDCFVKLI